MLGAARVPAAFIRIDVIKTVLRLGVETNAIEDEELGFGAEKSLVGNLGGSQVRLGLQRNLARVARVGLASAGLEGAIAPTFRGLAMRPRRKRNSSSRGKAFGWDTGKGSNC